MQLSWVLAMLGGVLAFAGIVWGLDGFMLAFVYAIPVTVIVVAAAARSHPKWRVQLYLVMWMITRPVALFVGLAIGGWPLAVVFLVLVVGMESVARRAHRPTS